MRRALPLGFLLVLLPLALSQGFSAPGPRATPPGPRAEPLPFDGPGSPIEIRPAARPGVTGLAAQPPDTVWFGGTVWSAANSRWEAIPGGTWTFDSGVGSHFVHEPGTCKDTTLHASMEGWTGVDMTSDQGQSRFRRMGVLDFSGSACVGSPAGLSGDYSFWVGLLEEEADSLCWAAGQGYGNSWNVCLEKPIVFDGVDSLRLEYDYVIDTEPGWDYVYVYCDTTGDGDDVQLAVYTGPTSGSAQHLLTAGTDLRSDPGPLVIKFCFYADGAYSDEDGLYTTSCGALALDDISVSNLTAGGTVDDFSDFETGENGWSVSGDDCGPGGDWSDLVSLDDLPAIPGNLLPCSLADSVLVFFDQATGEHPAYQDNIAISPWIDLEAGGAVGLTSRFMELGGYYNLPYLNYIFVQTFAQWSPDTCGITGFVGPSPITRTIYIQYFDGVPTCSPKRIDLTETIPAHATEARIAIGTVNYCRYYAGCTGVSNATPLFDNVRFGAGDFPWIDNLQEAIDHASDGDTLWVPGGRYIGSGNRDLDFGGKNLVLIGVEGPESTIIDCEGSGRGFVFDSGEDTTSVIRGFTITGGKPPPETVTEDHGGAILVTDSSGVSIEDCVFLSNQTTNGSGGALAVVGACRVLVTDCVFSHNQSSGAGGAVYSDYWASFAVDSCAITFNTGHAGGGIYGGGPLSTVTACDITDNMGGNGGGIFIQGGMTVRDCLIARNWAGGVSAGSGQWGAFGGSLVDCRIRDNDGIGVWGNHEVVDCLVEGSTGRGVELRGGIVANSVIRNNTGGGLLLAAGVASGCTITGNSGSWGGGVNVSLDTWASSAWVDSCLITGNHAEEGGGGLYCSEATSIDGLDLGVTRSTITGNNSLVGGGVYATRYYHGLQVALDRCVIWGNHADSLANEIFVVDTATVVTMTCSAVDTSGVAGDTAVQFIGPQVYDYPMFCAPEPWYHAPTTAGDYHLASNSPCLPESSPCDSLIGALGLGCGALGTPDTKPPVTRAMLSAWPNPAYGAVQIAFAVPEGGAARIEIFDVTGRLIRRLEPAQSVGAISWDRRSNTGARAPNGIYFLRLVGETETVSKRLVLIQ